MGCACFVAFVVFWFWHKSGIRIIRHIHASVIDASKETAARLTSTFLDSATLKGHHDLSMASTSKDDV